MLSINSYDRLFPWPSWPLPLKPTVKTSPALVRTAICSLPAAICDIFRSSKKRTCAGAFLSWVSPNHRIISIKTYQGLAHHTSFVQRRIRVASWTHSSWTLSPHWRGPLPNSTGAHPSWRLNSLTHKRYSYLVRTGSIPPTAAIGSHMMLQIPFDNISKYF